jgi:hypothetical protein
MRRSFAIRFFYAQFVVISSETVRYRTSILDSFVQLPYRHNKAENDDAVGFKGKRVLELTRLSAKDLQERGDARVDARQPEQHLPVFRKQLVLSHLRRATEVRSS